MGFLSRILGREPKESEVKSGTDAAARFASGLANRDRNQSAETSAPQETASEPAIPPERLGLQGEYDESGLAKRVALAFDNDPVLEDVDTLYVAQTGTTVVLKGSVPSQSILDRMVTVAKGVHGSKDVEINQVNVG